MCSSDLVVGSALVAEIENAKSTDDAAVALGARMRALKDAAQHGLSKRAAPAASPTEVAS